MDAESTFQALLTQAHDLEVGEAIDVEGTFAPMLADALLALCPERTFHLKPSEVVPFAFQLSRVMYVQGAPDVEIRP